MASGSRSTAVAGVAGASAGKAVRAGEAVCAICPPVPTVVGDAEGPASLLSAAGCRLQAARNSVNPTAVVCSTRRDLLDFIHPPSIPATLP
jgi:hypothetical protein